MMSSSNILFWLDIVQTTPTELSAGASTLILVVVTGISTLVVGVLTGVLTGVLVYHCIGKHRLHSSKPVSSSHQQQHTGPEYEEVSVAGVVEKIELRDNLAYGPMQRIEMRRNMAYEPM